MIPGIHGKLIGGYEIGHECFALASIDESPRFRCYPSVWDNPLVDTARSLPFFFFFSFNFIVEMRKSNHSVEPG